MPVNTPHNEYLANKPDWELMRDAIAGERTIKERGTTYLPKLSGQTDEEYNAYRTRAMFFGATGRTHDGLLGAVFRKAPSYELPSRIDAIAKDADLNGTPLEMLAVSLVSEILGVGRVAILTDWPENPVAEQARPYLSLYLTEQITNWRTRVINDVPVLDQVILYETTDEPAEDGYGTVVKQNYRVLKLDDTSGSLVYTVEIWEKMKEKEEWFLSETHIPTHRGKPLDWIPITIFSPHDLSPKVEKPPLLDLATVNVSHYRTSADLEHGCHWTAIPTPWVSGLTDHTTTLHVGGQTAWVLPENAQAGMLEFTGTGLAALEKRLQEKQANMARLGARLLEDQKRAAETEGSKRLDYSGDNSVLASVANAASEGLTRNLNWANYWAGGGEEEVEFAVNKDFFDNPLGAQDVLHLVAAWQSGGLPRSALYWNLHQGERLPPDMTEDEFVRQIEQEGPALGTIGENDEDDPEPSPDPIEDE